MVNAFMYSDHWPRLPTKGPLLTLSCVFLYARDYTNQLRSVRDLCDYRYKAKDGINSTFSNKSSWIKTPYLDCNFTEIVANRPIGNTSALIQVLAWHIVGDKTLHEPIVSHFTDAYIRPPQVETFSVSKTLTHSQEHPFVCRKLMLFPAPVNILNVNFTSKISGCFETFAKALCRRCNCNVGPWCKACSKAIICCVVNRLTIRPNNQKEAEWPNTT